MRFGLIHRIMTDALATLGLLSLVTSGDLDRWMSIVIVIGLVGALAIPERFQDHRALRRGGSAASVLLLAIQAGRLFLTGDVLELAVEFAAGLQVIRLATRRGAAHDQQIILLALLHLVAGTVLGGGLAYGLCFVGFLIVAPGALVLSHLRREVEGNYRQGARDRTGLPVDVPRILRSRRVISKKFLAITCSLSIPIFLFTAILFVLFPRVGLSLLLLNHSRSSRMVGFSDSVDLGGVGLLRSDPAIALRVYLDDLPSDPPPRVSLYLRGTAFDQYDGRTWTRTDSARLPARQIGDDVMLRRHGEVPNSRRFTLDLEPISPPVIFLPPNAFSMTLLRRGEPVLGRSTPVFQGPEGEFKYAGDDRGLRYQVQVATSSPLPPERLGAEDRERYLRVPRHVTPAIAELARRWASGTTSPFEMARALEQHLRTEYTYDLASPSGAAQNPLEHFLLESRRGHCEFYSTAMAMMLRTLGVPTRNVAGFVGGTFNRFGRFYAVRQGDAHSWIEAYIDGSGWTRFDPTPPVGAAPLAPTEGAIAFLRDVVEAAAQRWNRHIVGYDLDQQLRLLRTVSEKYASPNAPAWRSVISPRRLLLLLFGIALLILAYRYLRRERTVRRDPAAPPGAGPAQLAVVALYRQLETAMAARGIPRAPGTPPLAHARGLAALGHPLADELLELTEIYLDARFGPRELGDAERRDFTRRVRALRQVPLPDLRRDAA
jgi:protein-glutamine gamma-glutamyltransferase